MDEIAVYRSRIGHFAHIAHKQSPKRKPIPQRQRIKTFKSKERVPQKTRQSERKKRNRRQCHSFHNKVFILLILTSFFCFMYKSNICLETLNTNVKWYPEKTLEQSYNYSFTDHLHKNSSSGHYRDIMTQSHDTSPLFFPEANAWTCRGGTSEVTADSWLRQRTCYFLLGNKGMHCSNGNPRQDGAANDHGEVAITQATMHLIRERCNESVGFITVKDSYGTGFRVGDCFLMTAYHVLECMIDIIKDRTVHRLNISSDQAFYQLTSCLEVSTEKDNTESFDMAVRRVLDNFMKKTATNILFLLQCLQGSLDTVKLESEFTDIWKRNCVVDFVNHGQFYLDWRIDFGDEESDIAILRLLKTKDVQDFPRALLLDEEYRQHGNIKIIRYIHGDPPKVVIDQDTRVFEDNTELQAAKKWAINWWTTEFQDVEEDYFKRQYSKCCNSIDEVTGKVILRASKSFIQGSSGSPIIYMFNTDGVPVVEIIYQGGYPDFYYEPQKYRRRAFERLGRITVDCNCFFERGTTMKKVAELLKKYGRVELRKEIFSLPTYSADSKRQEYKEPTDSTVLCNQKSYIGQMWSEMTSLRDSYYTPIETLTDVDNALPCFVSCLRTSSCLAVGYVTSLRSCQIYLQLDKGSTVTNSRIWMHYKNVGDCKAPGYKYNKRLGFCINYHYTAVCGKIARAKCRNEGGRLMVVDTLDKHTVITNLGYKNFYVGGYRDNMMWYWLDGSCVNMSKVYWHSGQPSDGGENCLWYWFNEGKLLLDDQSCSTSATFMCEEFH